MPAKMTNGQLGYCPRCDGPLQPPPFAESMDQAFRSFGQPPPNFGSLDDLMRDLGTGPRPAVAARPPLWRAQAPVEPRGGPARTGGSSSSSTSSSSMRFENGGRGPSGLARVAAPVLANEPSVGLAPEVRASDLSTPERFVITIDVHDYLPEEIKVKTVDNTVVIEGRHEESRPGGQRYVSRNFSRSWTIPNDVDPVSITSKLSGGGSLTVEAPRRAAPPPTRDHVIPVHHGGRSRYF